MSNTVIKDTEFDNNASTVYEIKNAWGRRALIHDIIKINYVMLGYIQKNYPPHLLSDEEMIKAFLPIEKVGDKWVKLDADISFFSDYYPMLPNLSDKMVDAYKLLQNEIIYHLGEFLDNENDSRKLPDWVYSYMQGIPLGVLSPIADIHDYLVLIDNDNVDDRYEADTAEITYELSSRYLVKYPSENLYHRPPTIFAEPHVIRYANLLYNHQLYSDNETDDVI